MHIISTKVHGILDYAMGIVLILFPYLLPFSLEGMAHYFPMILGSATVLYSLCTAYEFGVMDLIPMRTHLVLDVLCAIFLIASPWVFGFADRIFLPHVILGVIELVAVALSESRDPHPMPSGSV